MATIPACDGRCCAVFPLSIPLVDLVKPGSTRDRWYILDMLVTLGPQVARERWHEVTGEDLPQRLARPQNEQLYTCRHWNAETGLCAAYEDRPNLCRDYPYTSACEYCGGEPPQSVIERRTPSPWQAVKRGYVWRGAKGKKPARDWRPWPGWQWDGRLLQYTGRPR